jgi:hypothetical protein
MGNLRYASQRCHALGSARSVQNDDERKPTVHRALYRLFLGVLSEGTAMLAEIFILRPRSGSAGCQGSHRDQFLFTVCPDHTAGREGVVAGRLAPTLQNLPLEGVCHGYDVLLERLQRRSRKIKQVLDLALEMTRTGLGLADDFANGIIAKRIIDLARAGERHPRIKILLRFIDH